MGTNLKLGVPYHTKMVDEQGNLEHAWQDFFDVIVQKIDALETTADNMQDISDQSVATATQIANYWQNLRSDLQNI